VIVPELNKGQLAMLLRAKYLVDVDSHTKVTGQPFQSQEIVNRISKALEGVKS
jgi:2-oxoglutarate ferredoxin oxidoreductase subunit alpha